MGVILAYLQSLLPPWLSKPRGKRFTKAFGDVGDTFRNDVAYGVRSTMIEEAGSDTYALHLRNSNLDAAHIDTPTTILAYLRYRWNAWRASGARDGMLYQLARLGYANAKIFSYVDLLIFILGVVINPNVFGANEGFFYIDIDTPSGFGPPVDWDDGHAWDDGHLWDLSEPFTGAIGEIITTVRKWKPVGSSCRFIRFRIGNQWIVVPVGETWEYDADGNVTDYYLTHI